MTLEDLTHKKEFLACGLMSGTSMDGVDAALVRMPAERDGALQVVAYRTTPYPDELRSSLADVAFGEQTTAEDIAILNTSVAVAFANSFLSLCTQANVEPATVDFIGSHGQTVAHVPPGEDVLTLIAGTLQLGPPGTIAALTGVTTVGDFRVGDIALGGQGAPLAPFVDYILRRSDTKNRIILNIGGIANVTYLPAGGAMDEVIAFDTGPGNMVVDSLYRALYPDQHDFRELDKALVDGRPSEALVDGFLDHPYFDRLPPKSAGHREFGGRFGWEFLSKAEGLNLKRIDVLASAVSLASRTIHDAVKKHILTVGDVDEVYITGGGLHNAAMLEELRMLLAPAKVLAIDELGVPADAKEAVDFAALARETILGRVNVIRQVTGASKATVLGAIALGGNI